MKRLSNDKQGFTLIEVIIVLAIIAIISAIVIPNFIKSTDSAKIKSDIQSIKAIQNAIDLYIAEYSKEPGTSSENTEAKVFQSLFDKGYISSASLSPQTEGANYRYAARKITLTLPAETRTNLLKLISEEDEQYITKP